VHSSVSAEFFRVCRVSARFAWKFKPNERARFILCKRTNYMHVVSAQETEPLQKTYSYSFVSEPYSRLTGSLIHIYEESSLRNSRVIYMQVFSLRPEIPIFIGLHLNDTLVKYGNLTRFASYGGSKRTRTSCIIYLASFERLQLSQWLFLVNHSLSNGCWR